jgi:SAM-dependent methyltransferase
MLHILQAKKVPADRSPITIAGDVCEQPFAELFDLVILPFQGLSELADESDHDRLLAETSRVLRPGGRFICTTHNPAVRQRTVDGEWHELGTFPTPDGGRLALALRTERVGESRVRGRQQVRRIDRDGRVQETREVGLEFSLPQPEDLLSKAAAAGLEVVETLGDYDEGPWDEATSPCFIVTFRKP